MTTTRKQLTMTGSRSSGFHRLNRQQLISSLGDKGFAVQAVIMLLISSTKHAFVRFVAIDYATANVCKILIKHCTSRHDAESLPKVRIAHQT